MTFLERSQLCFVQRPGFRAIAVYHEFRSYSQVHALKNSFPEFEHSCRSFPQMLVNLGHLAFLYFPGSGIPGLVSFPILVFLS